MSTVVVTGAATPVGGAFVGRLLSDPGVERVLGVLPPGAAPPPILPASERLTLVHADLTRERDVKTLIFGPARDAGARVVVHLATRRSARAEGRAVRALNVDAVRWLVDAAERQGHIDRFVLRSFADVYRIRPEMPTILLEDHPLELSPKVPEWVRDRVEADLGLCARMGTSRLAIVVLRTAECLAPECGSQLWDYLESRICFTPAGFDPMLNLITVEDLAAALHRATTSPARGVFNVPGADTLPLSAAIARAGRLRLGVPGPLIGPLYGLRAMTRGGDFRYDQSYFRFHFGGVMTGNRAEAHLGYRPEAPVPWSELFPSAPR